jgi:predicted nucleotidyltransferase
MTIKNLNIPEERLREICKRYLIRELAVFGSALREDFNEKSDIDLLVEFKPDSGISLFDVVDLKEEFERLFGRDIDLVSKNAMQKSRNYLKKKAILDNYKVIYVA